MQAEELARRIKTVIEEYPPGAVVWHKANGTRAIVAEYSIDAGGCVMITISTGPGLDWSKSLPCELSAVRVNVDTDNGGGWLNTEPDAPEPIKPGTGNAS